MGWSYRKSVNFGPFRVNLSRSGLGYSLGGRGFRIGETARGRRYSSIGIPGSGFRYTKSLGSGRQGCMTVLVIGVLCLAGVGRALFR